MKISFSLLIICLVLFSCRNPYKGFDGVTDKGMKSNTLPSQEIRDGYKKSEKKMNRAYKREMKRRSRRLGTKE
jgi:hypothetical protein